MVVVHEDGLNVIHLREDSQREYTTERFAEVVDTFRIEEPLFSPGIEEDPVGERRALLPYHENACVLQLPYSNSVTILVSMGREAGRDLVEFVESCREILRG